MLHCESTTLADICWQRKTKKTSHACHCLHTQAHACCLQEMKAPFGSMSKTILMGNIYNASVYLKQWPLPCRFTLNKYANDHVFLHNLQCTIGNITISPTTAKKTPPPLQCEGPCFYLKSYVFKTITFSPATGKADVCYDSWFRSTSRPWLWRGK